MINNNKATKVQYQDKYWQYTKEELQRHVGRILDNLDWWPLFVGSYNANMANPNL